MPITNFNPRSHEGSDFRSFSISSWCRHFNPRSHEGSDVLSRHSGKRTRISIHAPTKGATCLPRFFSCQIKFQSTLPRRERPCMPFRQNLFPNFNPRSHEGSDIFARKMTGDSIHFNPRSHEGSDRNGL